MSSNVKSLAYAAILCIIISFLLTTVSTRLQRFQARNILLDQYSNLLQSVGLLEEGSEYTDHDIEELYKKYIRRFWINSQGNLIAEEQRGEKDFPLDIYVKDGNIESYIVPINSRGLWGRIHGYLAIEKDGSTIAGFTVFTHAETPGLGGEIEKEWFQKNWVGKKIVDRNGKFVSITIAKGEVGPNLPVAKQTHTVDGISGATMTGRFLTAGIKEILEDYEPVSIRFRNNLITLPAADRKDTGSEKQEGP